MPTSGNVKIDFSSISTKTIPQLFIEKVKKKGDKVAFYYKNQGIYKAVDWQEYKEHAENLCLGFLELGIQRGDSLAIMGDPCPEWFYADIGIMSAGVISYGIHTTCSPSEVEYLIKDGGARFLLAENQKYVDKILTSVDRLPRLQRIIVADMRGMFESSHAKLMSFLELEQLGRQRRRKEPDLFKKLTAQGLPDDVACVIYTSGTGGKPKGAKVTHRNLVARCCSLIEIFPKILTHEHRVINHLNLAHALERDCCLYSPIFANITPYMGQGPEFLQQTIYEVQPNFFQGLPQIFEKMADQLVNNVQSSSWAKRKSYQWAMNIGRRYRQMCWDGGKSFFWHLLYWIASIIVFRRILNKAGLIKIKYALASGAPLPLTVQTLWQVWGVDMIDVYSSTETGFITSQRSGFPQPGDVGEPTSSYRVRLADHGEVLVSGPGVILGYVHEDAETTSSIENGWFYTGEIGRFDNGKLQIIESKRNLMTTSDGEHIAPSKIELSLKQSSYIREAIVFADKRKFPSTLIEINYDTVSEWARNNRVLYAGFTSLATHPEVYKLIAGEIESANLQLNRLEQVRKFRIIPEELDSEEEYMTPTRKIRRKYIYELFRNLIEEMNWSEEEELLEARIKLGPAKSERGSKGYETKCSKVQRR